MKKISYREELSTEYLGKTYHGYRIVEGTRKQFQTIHYKSHYEFDGHAYRPNEVSMLPIAKTILRELVQRDQEK